MRQQILDWFADDCPFLSGVALYRQIGGVYSNRMFEGYEFASYVPDDVVKKLKFALQSALDKLPESSTPATTTTTSSRTPQAVKKAEPDAIQDLRSQARKLHKRQAMLHAQLSQLSTEKERFDVAWQIMEVVIPQLDDIYDRIREWEKTGELPTASTNSVVQETVKKMQRRETLKSRISRLKSFLKKALEPTLEQRYKKELIDKELELKEIEEELGL